jgi:Leucine-rich repeat (LRR) protein
LILIDDIWNKSVWKNIRCALIENEHGSRIITTTRILDVAKEVGGAYQLQPLSTSDSRRLFYKRIFGTEDKCAPTQLAIVGENILRKCGGVPLAIITLASMLSGKKGHENTYTYWSKVYQSMGSGLENNPDLKDMRRILYVSYYDLPRNLKACLLYLSLYPEDYKIEAKALIWKWIGEGFVHEEQGKTPYEVGEAYFEELINKSLIQPMDINIANKASSCRVHDMVLDLIASLSNEENFLTTLGGQQPGSVPIKVRRLSLQTSKKDAKKMPTISFSSVRSLTVFSTTLSQLSDLSDFPVLRTLDLSGCTEVGDHHMKNICNLLHLRFLSLKDASITEIPKEIGKLQFLQVLDIRCILLKKLPSTFSQLRQLVFVDMGHRPVSTVILRSMSSLPLLSSLAIGLEKLCEENLQVLGSMPSLRNLSIHVLNSREGREKRLVIDNGCPFRSLTRLRIEIGAIDFEFTQGTLQMLQILWLEFDVTAKERFGDFHFGLENLASLEHVYVVVARGGANGLSKVMSNALQGVLDIHPNKPTLTVEVTPC